MAGQQARGKSDMTLLAYPLEPPAHLLLPQPMPLVPAPLRREWMDATADRYAYRCLPMLIANQAGWLALSTHEIRVTWDGGDDPSALTIEYLQGPEPYPAFSRFGSGIMTWCLPYLIRTPPGFNLLVRGPANWPKAGAYPLEGVVETDWSVAPFTMNWKLVEPGLPVTFAVGEPFCMLVPQRRGELEEFQPEIRLLDRDSELFRQHAQWASSRNEFSARLDEFGSPEPQDDWQKDYFRGISPAGAAPEHQSKLNLAEFLRRTDAQRNET